MGWRSVVISHPSYLKYKQGALKVEQQDGEVSLPLEDISVLLLDNPQITLSTQLLSACANQQIVVITVGADHHPNGVLLPHQPHSRALKVMTAQIGMSQPQKKRLWQHLVKQKILNQSNVLRHFGEERTAARLAKLVNDVNSGDTGNAEGQASQLYFPALFGLGFGRQQPRFHNAALNYGYAIIRAALARNLVGYGFITALGLHHRNEQNQFNLADDLIEPFRPLLDAYLLVHFPREKQEELAPTDKATLVNILHQDIAATDSNGTQTRTELLTAIEAAVISLSQRLHDGGNRLHLPLFATD
ncbi:MAG: type II CRISPR-associated endonuclease Cas1 [Porticoccaceae bacterium]